MGEIKNLRERYQLSRQQFSDLFCIPLRTVQSWELGDRSCPLYVYLMLEELLELKDLHGELQGFRKGDNNDNNS